MQFSAEMIARRTFPIVTEGYDPIADAAFLWKVADDYATLLNAASNLLEAVSPEGEDGQDGGPTGHSRPSGGTPSGLRLPRPGSSSRLRSTPPSYCWRRLAALTGSWPWSRQC